VEQGERDIVVQMLGYTTEQKSISVAEGRNTLDVALRTEATGIEQVVVSASGVGHLRRSAFNAVAVDTKSLQNTTQSISDAMSRAPGLRLRESGGVGSDMSLSVDGFSGKHVKIFIDGVPQEGVGSAFSLNNIPAGYAERI
jgi:outer membrane cobalamin receptor